MPNFTNERNECININKKSLVMFRQLLLLVLAMFMLSGCFLSKQRKLKSPCIKSNEGISCELYSVNDHWLNKYKL